MCTASKKDASLLYACVLEAQQTGDSFQILNSLQRVLEKHDYQVPNEIHLPALLRYLSDESLSDSSSDLFSCTARLLIREVQNRPEVTEYVDEICKLFEGGQYL